MKKLNLDFIGEIVESPAGLCCWSGTTIRFYGKFKDGDYKYNSEKFKRENLIEAVISKDRPSEEYFSCSACQIIPEKYLYTEYLMEPQDNSFFGKIKKVWKLFITHLKSGMM